ncbi:MAG: hypothetical protein ACK47B_27875 [Armatimonadota bacterium]
MSTATVAPDPQSCPPEEVRLAQVPYPPVGGSQHLALVHLAESVRPLDPRYVLPLEHLPHTVLSSAFYPGSVVLPTPLPAPHDRITLPSLPRVELREERLRDAQGGVLGMLLQVPGLFVHANQILHHGLLGHERYDYASAVGAMAREAGRLLAGVLKRGVLKVREKPGLMAHAQVDPRLRMDEVGISQSFAREALREVRRTCPLELEDETELDGFPTWTVRYPLANRWGIQELRLRVLPGSGRYLAVHPFNLSRRFLGDVDGDLLMCQLRVREVYAGKLQIDRSRSRLLPETELPPLRSRLTLQNLLSPEQLQADGVPDKLVAKFSPPDLRTREQRLAAIQAADAREHVAIYTMALGWWVSRVLATSGELETSEAYRRGYDLLELFMERCMDARKLGEESPFAGSPFAGGAGFDPHRFMQALLGGGELDWAGLETLGIAPESLACLRLAWSLSAGQLQTACAQSPVYWALVLRRKQLETSVPLMLDALQGLGVPPEELYTAIVEDLACLPGRVRSWPADALTSSGEGEPSVGVEPGGWSGGIEPASPSAAGTCAAGESPEWDPFVD